MALQGAYPLWKNAVHRLESTPCPICGEDVTIERTARDAHIKACEASRKALSASEEADLDAREKVIAQGLKAWHEVGEALLDIRDRRLYRTTHKTFEIYLAERWNIKRQRAYELIGAAQVTANLSEISDKLPNSESQAAELTTLTPDEQRLVWQVVQDTAPTGKVTAAHVASVKTVLKEIVDTGAIDDGEGGQIPVEAATVEHLKVAVTAETHERMMRQQEHIAEKNAKKEAKRAAKQIAHSVAPAALSGELYRLIHSDFRDALVADNSVDCIVTDPPYPEAFLNLYGDLAKFAARVLKPNASLLVMCGQSYLPDVLNLMLPHLRYHWTISYLTPGGQSAQLWQRQVNTFWKPVFWLTKGEYKGDWRGDVIRSDSNEKSHHEWQQSVSGMVDLVHRFTLPDQLVLDPFCGAGTTGIACVLQHRRFIGIDNDEKAIANSSGRIAACLTNPT